MPAESLLEFFTYLVPGFIARQMYRAAYPFSKAADFIEITWSLVWGLLIYCLVTGLDAKLHGHLVHNPLLYGVPADYRLRVSLLAVGIVWGGVAVGIYRFRWWVSDQRPWLRGIAPEAQRIWFKLNRSRDPQWATVFLDDGAVYCGRIAAWTFNPDSENQDFFLAEACRLNDDAELSLKYEVTGSGVYLSTRNVRRIEYREGLEEGAADTGENSLPSSGEETSTMTPPAPMVPCS